MIAAGKYRSKQCQRRSALCNDFSRQLLVQGREPSLVVPGQRQQVAVGHPAVARQKRRVDPAAVDEADAVGPESVPWQAANGRHGACHRIRWSGRMGVPGVPDDAQQAVLGDGTGGKRLVPDAPEPLVDLIVLECAGSMSAMSRFTSSKYRVTAVRRATD